MKNLSCLLMVIILSTSVAEVQEKTWNEDIVRLSSMGKTASDYPLGAGDLIEITFFGAEKLDRVLRVNGSGRISFPFLGEIQAGGLTAAELEAKLTSLVTEKQLLRYPQISVFIKEYKSKPIFVLGAVNNPGQYEMTRQLYLIDAIGMAGGLNLDKAESFALVRRSKDADPTVPVDEGVEEPEIIKVDLKELLDSGDLSLNLPLQGGNVVHVPERQVRVYFVVGEVTQTGAFELPADKVVMVSQAIANAGGPLKTAKAKNGILVRYDGKGGRVEMAANFSNILKGKATDFPVQPDDIIFIPGSNIKTLGYGLLTAIPQALTWGVIRY